MTTPAPSPDYDIDEDGMDELISEEVSRHEANLRAASLLRQLQDLKEVQEVSEKEEMHAVKDVTGFVPSRKKSGPPAFLQESPTVLAKERLEKRRGMTTGKHVSCSKKKDHWQQYKRSLEESSTANSPIAMEQKNTVKKRRVVLKVIFK